MNHILTLIGDVAVSVAALITTSLVIVYGVGSRFEETQVGRQFMLTKMMLALVLDYAAFFAVFVIHTDSPAPITRIIIYTVVGVVMLRWLIIIIRAQRSARRDAERTSSMRNWTNTGDTS